MKASHRSNRSNNHRPKNKSKGSQERRLEARDLVPERLPPVQDQLSVGITLRFVTTSLFTGQLTVTVQNLMDAWFLAGSATTAYQLFDFVRVKKVTIRASSVPGAAASGVPAMCTVGVEFVGLSVGTQGGGKQKTDTALGPDNVAMVSLKPDPKSQTSQFQASAGSSIFVIRATDQASAAIYGAIIDVDVVYRNSADISPAALGVARAGLTAGDLYFGSLDGNPLATTVARSCFQRRA